MSELDKLYIQLLQSGFAALRNAAQNGDLEHCRMESEHLHEIPSLIGESNINCHLFYINQTRRRYLEWASNTHRASVRELLDFFYSATWSQMDILLGLDNPKDE